MCAVGAPELFEAGDLLLSRMLQTLTSFLPVSIALGLKIAERHTVEQVTVLGAHAGATDAAAPLIRRLPELEPIDPFNSRRAEATEASVLWASDVGGAEHVAASMYGRQLRRHGYRTPVAMYFRSDGRIAYALALLRTLHAAPFDSDDVELLRELRPFLETALGFTRPREPPTGDVLRAARLTPREADVAGLVADGLSNARIALALGMSVTTVKTHLTHAYAKLGVRSRTQLAVLLPRRAQPASAAGETRARDEHQPG